MIEFFPYILISFAGFIETLSPGFPRPGFVPAGTVGKGPEQGRGLHERET
jgi:hypothetical protein